MASLIEIIADDRERTAPVIERLRANDDVVITVKRLGLGDYLVDQRLLFERKSQADLPASIVDGRLLSQSVRLAASRFRSVLVLEGPATEQASSGVSRDAIQGALNATANELSAVHAIGANTATKIRWALS
jgi:ERCC4-type nuclease